MWKLRNSNIPGSLPIALLQVSARASGSDGVQQNIFAAHHRSLWPCVTCVGSYCFFEFSHHSSEAAQFGAIKYIRVCNMLRRRYTGSTRFQPTRSNQSTIPRGEQALLNLRETAPTVSVSGTSLQASLCPGPSRVQGCSSGLILTSAALCTICTRNVGNVDEVICRCSSSC